jgi:hypothetical protein
MNDDSPTRWTTILAILCGALALGYLMIWPVHAAEGYVVSCDTSVGVTCFAGPMRDPYVREVPPPATAELRREAEERERRWVARCHPVIEPDKYGVDRYHYSAPGCEFGR